MDNLETPYDVDAEFIECTVCDKSIRGDTLYKIHLTTPGHLKKEDAFVAAGQAVRKHRIPEFQDILQYLDYLKLDEPLIGLSYLEELPSNDPQGGPKYLCRLCHLTANLTETVHHVIGRKHRQKYVEVKRPDLVTWDKLSILTQGGKIIRARAEIIERQDGRGSPVLMVKRGIEGKLNISRAPPRQRQNSDRNLAHSLTQRDVPSRFPELADYGDECSRRGGRRPRAYPNSPSFHPGEPCMSRDGQAYQREDGLNRDHVGQEPHGTDYRENDAHGREYADRDNRREYEWEYADDPRGRATLEPGGLTRYDTREEVPAPRGQTRHGEDYPEEAPCRRLHPERDPLKEFYSEEVRRGRVRSELQHSQSLYLERKHQWSLDREPGRNDGVGRASMMGSGEPEAKRKNFPAFMENDRSRDHLVNVIKDYQHKMRGPQNEVGVCSTGPPSSQRRTEVARTMSGIPEPFRRFLTGSPQIEGHGKRKRKSRFSDATAEELEMTKDMFSDEYGPDAPDPKFAGHPRPVNVPLRLEIHNTQYPDLYTEAQSPHHSESCQTTRGESGSESVFDMLKSIEIENAEEAEFLKNKLCSLLKEFKSKKSEKAMQNSQGRADYNSLNPDPLPSTGPRYERALREDSDLRRAQDFSFNDDRRGGGGWKQRTADEQLQEYQHPVRGEPGYSNQSHYKEVCGYPEISRTALATHPDEPLHYPERFQESIHPRDYRHAADFDSHSSPPLHVEHEPRMRRGPNYSKNLDKITSTLLELVARK